MDCQSATNSQKSAPGKFPKSSHYKKRVFFWFLEKQNSSNRPAAAWQLRARSVGVVDRIVVPKKLALGLQPGPESPFVSRTQKRRAEVPRGLPAPCLAL